MSRPDLPRIKPTDHHPSDDHAAAEFAAMDERIGPPAWLAWFLFFFLATLLGGALYGGVLVARWIG